MFLEVLVMAKSRKLEQLLAQLEPVRLDPTAPESAIVLRQVLTSKYSVAIAQAAKLIGAAECYEFIPDLVAAFDRRHSACAARTHLGWVRGYGCGVAGDLRLGLGQDELPRGDERIGRFTCRC
jgi:hypothetical protein